MKKRERFVFPSNFSSYAKANYLEHNSSPCHLQALWQSERLYPLLYVLLLKVQSGFQSHWCVYFVWQPINDPSNLNLLRQNYWAFLSRDWTKIHDFNSEITKCQQHLLDFDSNFDLIKIEESYSGWYLKKCLQLRLAHLSLNQSNWDRC